MSGRRRIDRLRTRGHGIRAKSFTACVRGTANVRSFEKTVVARQRHHWACSHRPARDLDRGRHGDGCGRCRSCKHGPAEDLGHGQGGRDAHGHRWNVDQRPDVVRVPVAPLLAQREELLDDPGGDGKDLHARCRGREADDPGSRHGHEHRRLHPGGVHADRRHRRGSGNRPGKHRASHDHRPRQGRPDARRRRGRVVGQADRLHLRLAAVRRRCRVVREHRRCNGQELHRHGGISAIASASR